MPNNYNRICPTCDEWYNSNNSQDYYIHSHPEPQSGIPRDQWMASRLSYVEWIKTDNGKAWENK